MPPGVIAVRSTIPDVPAGLRRTIWVFESLTKLVTATEPKSTAVAFARFVPTMVTGVPPAVGPSAGLTPVMVGAEAATMLVIVWLLFKIFGSIVSLATVSESARDAPLSVLGCTRATMVNEADEPAVSNPVVPVIVPVLCAQSSAIQHKGSIRFMMWRLYSRSLMR